MERDRQRLEAALRVLDSAEDRRGETWRAAQSTLRELAEDGMAAAEYQLGMQCFLGADCVANLETAMGFFRRAAGKGDPDARHRLGCFYLDGTGIAADQTVALSWFMLAAAGGPGEAREKRDRLLPLCQMDEIRQAMNLARQQPMPLAAGWLDDHQGGGRVWAPSWYRFGDYRLDLAVETTDDGRAHGLGWAMLTPMLPEDAKRNFDGRFENGFFVGEFWTSEHVEGLPDDDYLIELPNSSAKPHPGAAFWVRNSFHDLELSLAASGPNAAARVYARAADGFELNNDGAVKGLMMDAATIYDHASKIDHHIAVTVLPGDHEMVFENGETRFRPVAAEGVVTGFEDEDPRLQVRNFENHARRASEAEGRILSDQAKC